MNNVDKSYFEVDEICEIIRDYFGRIRPNYDRDELIKAVEAKWEAKMYQIGLNLDGTKREV